MLKIHGKCEFCSVVFKDLMVPGPDKDKDLRFEDKDKDLRLKARTRTCKLVLEDKDKDFPRGQQHWVTVKND